MHRQKDEVLEIATSQLDAWNLPAEVENYLSTAILGIAAEESSCFWKQDS
jgi:hypothetical protein